MTQYGFYGRLSAAFPSQFIVDVTEVCNLACIYCPHPDFKKSHHYASRYLEPELHAKLVDEVKQWGKGRTQYIRYTSQGEPMIHPKLFEMMSYAVRESGVMVTLTTNGTLMNEKRIEKLLAAIMLNTKVVKVVEERDGIRVTFDGGDRPPEQVFDRVLVAVGRRPNSNIPGLQSTRVRVDHKGFIETDPQRRTTEPSIFAIGDVAGEPMLAHKASHEGRVAIEAIAGHKAVFEPLAIPAVVFTDPEIAWCGVTEAQAAERGMEVEIAKFPWGALSRAITIDRPEGLTKLVLDRKSGRVLGVGIAGAGAGELIAEGVLAVEMGATADDMKLTIHPHPTLSESLMESAEMFFGQSTHVYKPKRQSR